VIVVENVADTSSADRISQGGFAAQLVDGPEQVINAIGQGKFDFALRDLLGSLPLGSQIRRIGKPIGGKAKECPECRMQTSAPRIEF
jgi:hypothetical protein